MKKKLAFVLGGGGARGALQVGAVRALLESGYHPDVLVGTSIGAANAAFLALHAANSGCIKELVKIWQDAAAADLLPANYLWLTVRTLFNRPNEYSSHRMRDFLITHGLSPDLQFGDIRGVQLLVVAADLNSGRLALYGLDPRESVLEGVLASAALPPWVLPIEKDGQLLMDGGAISTLPIEPALLAGVTEIIALDLADYRAARMEAHGFGSFIYKLMNTVEQRQIELELALAAGCNVPVRQVHLLADEPVPLWDFRHSMDLIACGYQITCREIERWQAERKPGWLARWLPRSRNG